MENITEETKTTDKTDKKKYVTFAIGEERFAIEVMRAKEVMYLLKITEVPNTMAYMRGVIDLRGLIVPLVDTRIKFKLKEKKYDDDTVIILVEFQDQLIGLIVDAVLDVLNISSEEIQDTTHFTVEIDQDYVDGIVKLEEELIIVLDVDNIFTDEELNRIQEDKST